MAVTQNPLIGRASGSFAGAVFSTSYGKNQIRSKPVEVSNPNTDAQKLVRQKFAAVSDVLRQALPFFKEAYKDESLQMPVYSHLMGYAFKNAASGTLDSVSVDYGKLSPAQDVNNIASLITLDKDTENEVTAEWTASLMYDKIGDDGTLSVMLIDQATGDVFISTLNVDVDDEQVMIPVPGVNTGKTFNCWVMAKKRVVKFKAGSDLSDSVK
jgi:hypothetical protein